MDWSWQGSVERANQAQDRTRGGEADSARQPVRFYCPYCEMVLEAPVGQVGVRGPCPGCRKEIEAPPPAALPSGPRPIPIKPRPHRARVKKSAEAPASPGTATPTAAMPAMGSPPLSAPIFGGGSTRPQSAAPSRAAGRGGAGDAPHAEIRLASPSQQSSRAIRQSRHRDLGTVPGPEGIHHSYQDPGGHRGHPRHRGGGGGPREKEYQDTQLRESLRGQ